MTKLNLKTLDLPQLTEFITTLGQPSFRAKQVWQWLWQKGARSFEEMTNLSKELRAGLLEQCEIPSLQVITRQESAQDGTVKFLYQLPDGEAVESVLMRHNYGNSVCVSTQVGCRMGCRFCASTLEGRVRDLEPWEIYEQVLRAGEHCGERISSVVIMGTGEPLDNYDNVLKFIRLVNSPDGLNIGQRHITLSTCGLVPNILRLAEEGLDITLSISLHATSDATRSELMPVNRRYPMGELLATCRQYIQQTGRRITFEYSLLSGINDSREEAGRLGRLLKGMLCHVNLIPVNPVMERGFHKPTREKVEQFRKVLEEMGIETTVRRELGGDIDAACGQLRRRVAQADRKP